ncbi:MAG: rRNA maturation RNase YbeY [Candidatus Margulisiibacteriota bacterium]
MFDKLIAKILKAEGIKGAINLVVVDDIEIRRLNLQYRHKDKATDVLSFSMGDEGIIGDIAISSETTRRNAARFGVKYTDEMQRLVIHGVLHLLGYDHGKRMRDAEKTYQKF